MAKSQRFDTPIGKLVGDPKTFRAMLDSMASAGDSDAPPLPKQDPQDLVDHVRNSGDRSGLIAYLKSGETSNEVNALIVEILEGKTTLRNKIPAKDLISKSAYDAFVKCWAQILLSGNDNNMSDYYTGVSALFAFGYEDKYPTNKREAKHAAMFIVEKQFKLTEHDVSAIRWRSKKIQST